jgi:hypothetical protein
VLDLLAHQKLRRFVIKSVLPRQTKPRKSLICGAFFCLRDHTTSASSGHFKCPKLISKYLTIFSLRLIFKTNVNFDFLNQACFDGGFISLKLIKKT